MKQRTGRQKFHDLRLMTFQDWILPRYNSRQRKASEIMKNGRLPVFSYTKMDNGPPLSPISSQFAWAGHTLPDLVQEQSDRLLRRLERPRTADNRISNHNLNNQMKGGKLTRPSTAVLVRRTPPATKFHVSGTKYDGTVTMSMINVAPPPEILQNLLKLPTENQKQDAPSPISDRSNSPDFIANLYKEYEKKLASEDDKEMLSPSSKMTSPTTPTTKLLRRPSVQFHFDKNSARRKSSSLQTSPKRTDKIVHCIVKLPSDQTNSYNSSLSNGNLQSKSEPPKSETWLDLSELCQPSDEENTHNSSPDDIRLHRPSIASESGSSLKILDLLSGEDDLAQDKNAKKMNAKVQRPNSSNSRNPKKSRPKSRMKKKRPNSAAQAEESTKEYIKAFTKSSEINVRKTRSSDKLKEEIETQMSKLDFENSAREKLENPAREKLDPVIRNPPPTKKVPTEVPPMTTTNSHTVIHNHNVSRPRRGTWKSTPVTTNTFPNFRSSIPLKKIPIQILSDPFSSCLKRYENEK